MTAMPRSRSRTKLAPVVAAALAVLVGGCGQEADDGPAGDGASRAAPAGYAAAGYSGRFRAAGTVLEDQEHGPQLCLNVDDSLPPQCGGIDLVRWDWSSVDSRSVGGVRWADDVTVVGTYDGERLTLAEPPVVGGSARTTPEPDFSTRCKRPAGGWRPSNPATATVEGSSAAMQLAHESADYAGGWIDQSYLPADAPPEQANDPTRYVLNLQFTGDLERHEAEVRRVWGGALCVTRAERPLTELVRIQQELTGVPGGDGAVGSTTEDGLPSASPATPRQPAYWSWGVDELQNRVHVTATVAWWEEQQRLDERYGRGAVQLSGWLTPVD